VAAIYPSATIQDNVVKYIVAVAIRGNGGLLRPEMTASVHIRLEERMVLAIPARAVSRQGGQSVVYLWRQGRAERRAVRLGWRDGPWVEVLEGLQEGDCILLDAPASTEAGNS
jgi:macrolide-specific efflux system membrane fusion protein